MCIRDSGRDVAVTEDVFAAYAQMDRRERYLSEDLPKLCIRDRCQSD